MNSSIRDGSGSENDQPVVKGKCGTCKNCMNPHWHKRCLELPPTNAVRKSSKPKEVSFVDNLRDIIQPDGSIKGVQYVPQLSKLVNTAKDWSHRKALLKVLQASSASPLDAFISQGGLLKMEIWIAEAIPDNRQKFIALMLSTLSHLPVTLASLKKPCELGKAVGKLRKLPDLDESIRSQARILVMKWKALIDTKTLADNTPKMPSKATEGMTKPVPSSPKGPQAGLGDVDIFNVRPQKKTVTGSSSQRVRVVASNAAKSQMMETNKSTSVAKVSASPLDSLSGPDMPKQVKPPQASSRPRTVLTPATNGIPLMTGHMTAAQRAKLAAESIPDEPPRQKRKQGTRRITWASEDELVTVRLFLKNQPPCKASHDATLDDISNKEEMKPENHENFEKAAKEQHHSEAQALKDFKAQEEIDRKVIEQRMLAMRPAVPWRDPPFIPKNIFEEFGMAARGEESTEKVTRQAQTKGADAKVFTIESAPPSAEEPPVGASMPIQPMHLIPKIPLSIEEARKLASEKRVTIPMSSVGNMQGKQEQRKPIGIHPPAIHPPATRQPPPAPIHKMIQQNHRPMASQKFGGPMLGLHGASKAHQPQQMTSHTPVPMQQAGPRPIQGTDSRQVCAFFNRPKSCIHGDKCKFAHVRMAPEHAPPPPQLKRPPPPPDGGAPRKMVKHS